MPFLSEFPISTRAAQPDAVDEIFDSTQALLESTEPARGAGAVWRVRGLQGVHLYEEQALDTATCHLRTAADVPLCVVAPNGALSVDAFGAVGDGTTDDTMAIQIALDNTPDYGTLIFSAGKTYIVSDTITSTHARSLTVMAHGATIKCAADSVWHVFFLGGVDADHPAGEVRWFGGTFDGNLENQRYWPSEYLVPHDALLEGDLPDPLAGYTIFHTDQGRFATNDDGATYKTWTDTIVEVPKHSVTGRVLEDYEGPIGRVFYENSWVNGAEWSEDWINGARDAPYNVKGNGNSGLLRVQHAQVVVFDDITLTDFVRNGLVSWNVKEVYATRVRSYGQLPTSFFELNTMYGRGSECSAMKFGGDGGENSILNGRYCERVYVSDCSALGGALPLFIRTNEPKPPTSGIAVMVDRCQFYGISREMWFEVPDSLTISDCIVICADYPSSTQRKDAAIFIGSAARNVTINNSYVYGRINTNVSQIRYQMDFINSHLVANYEGGQRALSCNKIVNSLIESRSGGILAEDIIDSKLYLDSCPGSESFKVQNSITSSEVGKDRYEFVRDTLTVDEDTNTCTLSGVPDVITRLQVRARDYHGGRWYDVYESYYKVVGDTISFETSSNGGYEIFNARGGPVEVEVEWYANREDTFTTTSAAERAYTLTQTGGTRTQDILSVTYDNDTLEHAYQVSEPATDPHWTSAMNASGFMVITLVNVSPIEAADLVVAYTPPLKSYRTLELGPKDTIVDIQGRNFEGILTDGGKNFVSGIYTDIHAPAFFLFKDETELVDIDGARVERMAGGLLCGTAPSVICMEGRVTRSHILDWMLAYEFLFAEDEVADDGAVGCVRKQGTQFTHRFQVSWTTMEYSGRETGASTVAGNNRADVLKTGYAVTGGNIYLGGVSTMGVTSAPTGQTLATADFT